MIPAGQIARADTTGVTFLSFGTSERRNDESGRRIMKAIRISAPVGVDGLVYEDAPDPQPAIGDVLVMVHACGFTASELFWPIFADRAGHDRTPLIPGHEFSGVVVGLGPGTAGVALGDEVYGLIDGYRDGAAAELMAIEARDVAPAPTTIDHVQAASLPQAGLTSWQALFDHGRLIAGQTALIHGAAGAVGSIAVQLAKAKGARVIGTGRAAVKALVLDLGADEFVDLENDDWAAHVEPVDVVFDTVGGDVLARSVDVVKPDGALVSVTSPPPAHRDDIRTIFFIRDPNGPQLTEIARLVDEGKLRPQVGAVYPLAAAREAFAAKSAGGIPGRVVLQP
jgi:NADPH:quinone reductase-like Zn-dependent oxidoreductase